MERQILHVEVGAFAVAVERIVNPRLAGRPVLVARASAPRAPVLSVSDEARAAGARSGMPLPRALRLVRDAAVVPPNLPLYLRATRAFTDLLGGFSPLLETTGYGRVFLDLTGTRRLFGPAQDLAARLEREIRARLRLSPTVGLASNKLVSRMASRVPPPASLCDVFPGSERTFLAPLPAGWLPDLELPTRRALAELNLLSVGDLAALDLPQLSLACGPSAWRLHRQALGVDDSPVRPPERAPAVAVDETLAEDTNDERAAMAVLRELAERAGRLLRQRRRAAAGLRLRLRYSDGVEALRRMAPREPLCDDFSLWEQACRLLEQAWKRRLRLRYLELRAEDLVPAATMADLFGLRPQTGRRLDLCAALDRLRARHGEEIILSGACWARATGDGAGAPDARRRRGEPRRGRGGAVSRRSAGPAS
jgi:DNA polymerase-4